MSQASMVTTPAVAQRGPAVRDSWGPALRIGLIGLAVAIYLCVVGIVGVFSTRPIVAGVISLGDASLLLTFLGAGWVAAQRGPEVRGGKIAAASLAGALAGLGPAILVALRQVGDYRWFVVQASPDLFNLLTLGLGFAGIWVMPVVGLVLGGIAGGLHISPRAVQRPTLIGFGALMIIGLFSPLIRVPLQNSPLAGLSDYLFEIEGLTPLGALLTVIAAVGLYTVNRVGRFRQRIAQMPADRQRTLYWPTVLIAILFVVWLPQGIGSFFAQVVAIVAIYILMGFGLNITLGLAGLLDLGFVAFFAVGAYTVGLMTSTGEFGLLQWPFWAAVPFAVIFAMVAGLFLGLPILGIRGDYLAIATLGFGEIVRLLAGSDVLKPWLGGPQGVLDIGKPIPTDPTSFLAGPLQIYYIALFAAAVVAFVAIRLRDSRLGRAWVAIREDEDVAEALGVHLVQTKLLAYMIGAGFAGLGGAIFAGLIGSIFASSMQLYVSFNVAAIIIVGGMGSIPGVVLGAIFLVGLPELFREFSEYRLLFYGMALIAMMLYRPEGLLPSRIVRRELHADTAQPASPSAVPVGETPTE